MIRYDITTIQNLNQPQLRYFIKDICDYSGIMDKFFIHDIAEICYVISGEGTLYIKKGNIKEEFPVKAGDMYIINPYVPHWEYVEKSQKYTYYIVGVANFKMPLVDGENVYKPVKVPQNSALIRQLDCIFEEQTKQTVDFENAVQLYFQLLLIEIQRFYQKELEVSKLAKNRVAAQIKEFIEANFAGEISTKFIAGYFGKKLNTIEVLFKREYGISIQSFILQLRIENAKRMLEYDNLSIMEISSHAGFYNPTYFARYFRKVVGMSPSAYRKSKIEEQALQNKN